MAIKVVCEECEKMFRVPDKHAGKKIRCPKCQSPILVEDEDDIEELDEERIAPAPKKRRRPAPPVDRDDDGDEDAPRSPRPKKRPRPKKKQGPSKMALWIGIGGGVAFLVIVGLVVVLYFMFGRGIVGKWQDASTTSEDYIEFKGDGTVTLSISGTTVDGTYKLEGDQLSMTLTRGGRSVTQTATVKFEDSNTLVVTPPTGRPSTMKRK